MADKYEDLHDEIADSIHWDATVLDTLKWLDEHPGQAPGRTLTRSDMVEAFGEEYAGWATHCLARVGYTIAPNPEPTNMEKLEADLVDWYAKNKDARPSLADHLIERGWAKEPGGDDD